MIEFGDHVRIGELFGCDVEGVEVAGGAMAEQDRRVVLLPLQCGRGKWGGVTGQDLLKQLGCGSQFVVRGSQDCVRVSVADHGEIEVVGGAAAGQHGAELLPRLRAGSEAVHAVDSDALGAVDGAGVAEFGDTADVVSWQGHSAAVLCVPHLQIAGPADIQDGPSVAVFDPVGGADAEPPVVSPGDDHIAGGRPVAVGQLDLSAATAPSRRWTRARELSWVTRSWVGASMIASRPRSRSACHAVNSWAVGVAGARTCTRCRSR